MALHITSLNSGSNGNCYYVGNAQEAVLIDAGISCRETERRMKRLGLSMELVRAIFISHEHSDHIRGVAVLARKYGLPVYITGPTLRNSRLGYEPLHFQPFAAYAPVKIGNLEVIAFPKFHDAADPHSFIVRQGAIRVGVFTDIGAPCEHVIGQFQQCHAAFLETNYDEDLLERGHYPSHLKRRIRGDKGHLSNAQALDMFLAYKPDYMSHVLLSHLSRDNNDPMLVQALFETHADGTAVIVASRYTETAVFTVTGEVLPAGSKPVLPRPPKVKVASVQTQLAFPF